jgi:uncharacterized SAM-dependent methyltransferase
MINRLTRLAEPMPAPGRRAESRLQPQEAMRLVGNAFAVDVIAGPSAREKTPPPKYFYDACGSELFDAICRTPEYCPTRVETTLLKQCSPEIAAGIPEGAVLVEFASGASDKTRVILDAAPQIAVYVPIDTSEDALAKAAATLSHDYPELLVVPVAEDITDAIRLPVAAIRL